MRAIWIDSVGCLGDRRITGPRRWRGGTAIPSNPTAAKRTPPRRAWGRLLRKARNAEREERGRSAPAAPSCPTPRREFPLRSSAEVPISAVTACASRYRSHSSFVDGRDARLVMGRLPSVGDERPPRHPPLRARRLNLEGRGKGAWCVVGFSERRVFGTRSNRIGPHITGSGLRKGTGRGRLDRHAHGARGDHSPKQAVTELARPALAARNPEERVHRAKASRQRVQELLNRREAPPADGRGGSVAALAPSKRGARCHASMWDRNRQG
jgi:hypothetical protein